MQWWLLEWHAGVWASRSHPYWTSLVIWFKTANKLPNLIRNGQIGYLIKTANKLPNLIKKLPKCVLVAKFHSKCLVDNVHGSATFWSGDLLRAEFQELHSLKKALDRNIAEPWMLSTSEYRLEKFTPPIFRGVVPITARALHGLPRVGRSVSRTATMMQLAALYRVFT